MSDPIEVPVETLIAVGPDVVDFPRPLIGLVVTPAVLGRSTSSA